MSYKVYEFENDKTIMALPITWGRDGKVPFSTNAANFIATQKKPLKKWPLFKVSPVDERTYDNYKSGLKAEIILMEKTDIESSDYERVTNINDNNGSKSQIKKAQVDAASSYLSSSEESNEGFHIPIAPAVPVKRFHSCHDSNSLLSSYKCAAQNSSETQFEVPSAIHDNLIESISSPPSDTSHGESPARNTFEDNTSGNLLSPQNEEVYLNGCNQNNSNSPSVLTLVPYADFEKNINEKLRNMIREELTAFRTLIKDDLKTILKEEVNINNVRPSLKITSSQFENEFNFPLNTIEDLIIFDDKIKDDTDSSRKFRYYLTQIGGRHARDHLKVVSRIYSLDLQKQISYTGREKKKFAVKNLKHIQILIETLMQSYTELTERMTISLLQKYLQQTCDRIRAEDKKRSTKIDVSINEENNNCGSGYNEEYLKDDE